jgi:hypothetical protein
VWGAQNIERISRNILEMQCTTQHLLKTWENQNRAPKNLPS